MITIYLNSVQLSILLLLITVSEGLYFHIHEGERKCFIEEIPDDTLIGMFLFTFMAGSNCGPFLNQKSETTNASCLIPTPVASCRRLLESG